MIHNYYLSELVEVMAVNHLVAMFPFIKLGNLVDLPLLKELSLSNCCHDI